MSACVRVYMCVDSPGQIRSCPKMGSSIQHGEKGHCLDNVSATMVWKLGVPELSWKVYFR